MLNRTRIDSWIRTDNRRVIHVEVKDINLCGNTVRVDAHIRFARQGNEDAVGEICSLRCIDLHILTHDRIHHRPKRHAEGTCGRRPVFRRVVRAKRAVPDAESVLRGIDTAVAVHDTPDDDAGTDGGTVLVCPIVEELAANRLSVAHAAAAAGGVVGDHAVDDQTVVVDREHATPLIVDIVRAIAAGPSARKRKSGHRRRVPQIDATDGVCAASL